VGKLRKTINTLFGVTILVGISYCSYNFLSAESRMRAVCNQIQQGMTVKQLQEFVSIHGLIPQPKKSGTSFVVETKTYGRFGCKVITEAGFVKEAKYIFAD